MSTATREPEPNTRPWWEARAAEARRQCEWRVSSMSPEDRLRLPFALDFNTMDRGYCYAMSDHGDTCNRVRGHGLRHAQRGHRYVLAVWL